MKKEIIEQIAKDPGVLVDDVKHILDYLTETQITTYTFADPDGFNFPYPNLDDLLCDLDPNEGAEFPVYMQIEFRNPIYILNGRGENVQ